MAKFTKTPAPPPNDDKYLVCIDGKALDSIFTEAEANSKIEQLEVKYNKPINRLTDEGSCEP